MKLTKKTNSASKPSCSGRLGLRLPLALVGALVLIPTTGLLAAFPAAAEQRAPIERVVDGKVTGKSDTAISGAVVYLKDSRSLAMKTYITDDAGHFHFGQLSQNTDYELWAVSNGARSKSRTISSFDDKSAYNFTLKIDAK
jgi:hypothetical protein